MTRRPRPGAENPNWRGGKTRHPLYGVYNEMRNRCENATHKRWSSYGGRGISVCTRWTGREGFWNFVEDMGPRPEGVGPSGRSLWSLERVDNDGNYEPGNVIWAQQSTQSRNRRRTAYANALKTHCLNGHPFSPENTYVTKQGHRHCRACHVVRMSARYARIKQKEAA